MTVWATAKVFTYLESRFKGLHSCSSYLLHSQLARPPRSKTSAVPRHLYCPFHPVLSRSGDFLKCSAQNYSKSQKSKFQIDLTATVFELDSSCWASSPLYMPRLPSTNFGADLVTFEKKSPSKSCSFFRRPNFDQKFQISENLPNIVLRHVQALGIIWSHLEQVRWVSKSVPL